MAPVRRPAFIYNRLRLIVALLSLSRA
jgi:hypothetical protein